MATRSIVTHQPAVSCDVCGRRLLRGERPDVFVVAGSRRTVCELCVPRAAEEGWTRAADALDAPSAAPPRGRRPRSLLERLRQRRDLGPGEHRRRSGQEWGPEQDGAWESGAVDPTEGDAARPWPEQAEADAVSDTAGSPLLEIEEYGLLDAAEAAPPVAGVAEQALEVFNASEFAARVAGIARALGEPTVTVRAGEEGEDRVGVLVAWELCWYRYEIDLTDRPATIAQIADGTELAQLDGADQLANAVADERGELSLVR